MKRCYREIRLRAEKLDVIENANLIIAEYQQQGLKLTLRQLYYQFVSRDLIANTDREYKKLAGTISDGRLAGYIDWNAIEDRGRQPDMPAHWGSVSDIVEAAARSFRLPRWEGQETYCELWVEKQALAGVLEPLARDFHVTLMVNKGYSSQSAMYDSAQRYLENTDEGLIEPVLFYLGDHDPSGEDMVRDIRERLQMFGVEDIRVEKLALTMPQIQQFRPPPNPAKITDSRAAAYIEKHGDSSWEVDALNPSILAGLIRAAFDAVIDRVKMDLIKLRKKKAGPRYAQPPRRSTRSWKRRRYDRTNAREAPHLRRDWIP